MLVIDQVRRSDPRLRFLAAIFFVGFAVLLTGLWYVQIVSQRKYETSLKVQSFRTVRIPAARGRILDRNGHVLADNQPRYNINLFLEDIRPQFTYEYTNSLKKEFVARNGRNPNSSFCRYPMLLTRIAFAPFGTSINESLVLESLSET